MSYAGAVEHLNALSGELAPVAPGTPRRKFDLDHMRTLCAALGNPEAAFPSVLIAGTNGKGSTAATLASICSVAGLRTGLYTSPHLLRVNERIQISTGTAGSNSLAQIQDDTFARLYFQVDDAASRLVTEDKLPHMPSFFEVMTAMAFLAFQEAGVDIAILEVGMGGRLDATNVVKPLVSVITDIALDHTEWLGQTLTAIATEKAGILRPGGILVTLPQHPEANAAIGEIAMLQDVTGVNAAAYLPERNAPPGPYGISFGGELLVVSSPLHGEHQQRNVALAVACASQLSSNELFAGITSFAVEAGVRLTRWSGRLEVLHLQDGVTLLLDVAHNPAGAWTLRSYLSRTGTLTHPRTLVFSALRDKSVREMAQVLFPVFDEPGDRILLAPVNSPRATPAEELSTVASDLDTAVSVHASVPAAMDDACSRPGTVVVAGSVYLVGEAMVWLEGRAG